MNTISVTIKDYSNFEIYNELSGAAVKIITEKPDRDFVVDLIRKIQDTENGHAND